MGCTHPHNEITDATLYKVHIGEFMDKEKGVCPKCGTKHETFMPLFPQQTMGRVVFKKKVNKFGSV